MTVAFDLDRPSQLMEKEHSHYDNLKVARDAPIEVIRAAYRSLSQKYHPDRNNGSETATQAMKLLNMAYETLSDLAKRRQYDAWINAIETGRSFLGREGRGMHEGPVARHDRATWRIHLGRYGLWYLLAIFSAWTVVEAIADQSPNIMPRYVASQMIFETALTSPSLLKIAEIDKASVGTAVANLPIPRPLYVGAIAVEHSAEKNESQLHKHDSQAVAVKYDLERVLEDL